MSYLEYVIAAYVVFLVIMLWEWLSPRLQIRRAMRSARLLAKRKAGASS